MKIENIDKDTFFAHLSNSTSFKDLSEFLGFNIRKSRCEKIINKMFGIDICEEFEKNRNRIREEAEEIRLNQLFTCDNPDCGKIFKLREHNVQNKSGKHYCSYKCGHHVSSSAKKEERYKKSSETLKRKVRTICCMICGKELTVHGTVSKKICVDCKNGIRRKRKIHCIEKYTYISNKTNGNDVEIKKCAICGADYCKCKHPEICNRRKAFPRMIKYLGFDENTIGSEDVYNEFYRVKSYVEELYWNRQMSINDIRQMCGYPYSTGNFSKLLLIFIKFRSVKESLLISQKTFQNNKFFNSGYHKTWDGNIVFYRSSYEKDFCIELDSKKIQYEMESKSFDYYDSQLNKMRFAIPDFFIPSTNTIVEIKSTFTYNKQNMIDRASVIIKNGYNFSLILEHKRYDGLSFIENTTQSENIIEKYNNG